MNPKWSYVTSVFRDGTSSNVRSYRLSVICHSYYLQLPSFKTSSCLGPVPLVLTDSPSTNSNTKNLSNHPKQLFHCKPCLNFLHSFNRYVPRPLLIRFVLLVCTFTIMCLGTDPSSSVSLVCCRSPHLPFVRTSCEPYWYPRNW